MLLPRDKILTIMERVGMSSAKAAQIMGITDNTFRKYKMDALDTHLFNEQNYESLIDFLIQELEFFIEFKEKNSKDLQAYNLVIDRINNAYKEYHKYQDSDYYNLFEELKVIVDFIEKVDVFENEDIYDDLINLIVYKSVMLKTKKNIFTIEKYNDYAKTKSGSNEKWIKFMDGQKTLIYTL